MQQKYSIAPALLFARGDKKVKLALQQCFGRAILQKQLGPESATKPPYELNPLKTRVS